MGCGSSQNADPEIIATMRLLKAYYDTKLGYRFIFNLLNIKRSYIECNLEYKDLKELAVIKKCSFGRLLENRIELEAFYTNIHQAPPFMENKKLVDVTEFAQSVKKLEKTLSDDTFEWLERISELKYKLEALRAKQQNLKLELKTRKVQIENFRKAHKSTSHHKNLSSGNCSAVTNISNHSYNISEDGNLTERSLTNSLANLRCVSGLDSQKTQLISKVLLRFQMLQTYNVTNSTLNSKLAKAKETIQELETKIEKPQSCKDPLDFELITLQNKVEVLQAELENDKNEERFLRDLLATGQNFTEFQKKQLELLEERASRSLNFLF